MTRPVVCVHGVSADEDASGFSLGLRDEVVRQATGLGILPPAWAEAVYSDLCDLPGGAITAPIDMARDVSQYEHDNALQIRVVQRVAEVVRRHPGCILLGHSLGSVVCLDTLALLHDLDVHALVTLGSPLGIDARAVSFIWRAGLARRWWPSGRRWLDLWDASDPIHTGNLGALDVVQGAMGLRSAGYPCESQRVDVGCDPYTSHVGYWQSTQVAAAVLDLATEVR